MEEDNGIDWIDYATAQTSCFTCPEKLPRDLWHKEDKILESGWVKYGYGWKCPRCQGNKEKLYMFNYPEHSIAVVVGMTVMAINQQMVCRMNYVGKVEEIFDYAGKPTARVIRQDGRIEFFNLDDLKVIN